MERHSCYDIASSAGGEWVMNGRSVSTPLEEYLASRTMLEVESWGSPLCPWCRVAMEQTSFDDLAEDNDHWHYERKYVLGSCHRCAHWEFFGIEGGNRCMDPMSSLLVASVAVRFDTRLPSVCHAELAQALRREPKRWHTLAPTVMERFIADVFKANYCNCEVIHVGGPNDCGIDIVFIDDNRTKWLIQVKRRAHPGKAEGFATLQSVLGTLALEGERHGMIVTCADYFSHHAYKQAQRAAGRGFTVELMDKGVLDRMIGAMIPKSPWEAFFGNTVPSLDEGVRQYFLARALQLNLFDVSPAR